jgi:hypothetical protein
MSKRLGPREKLEKILAAYDRFSMEISNVPDEFASKLVASSSGLREKVQAAMTREPDLTRGQIVAGLEQGLRETPDFIFAVSPEWRPVVAKAFRNSINAEYPEFLLIEQKQLSKIRARGRIVSESEYYLIRHQVDVFEGNDGADSLLKEFYLLIAAYERRQGRV